MNVQNNLTSCDRRVFNTKNTFDIKFVHSRVNNISFKRPFVRYCITHRVKMNKSERKREMEIN